MKLNICRRCFLMLPKKLIHRHHPSSIRRLRVWSVNLFDKKYFWFPSWYFFVGHINKVTNMVLLLVEHCWAFARNAIRRVSLLFILCFFWCFIQLLGRSKETLIIAFFPSFSSKNIFQASDNLWICIHPRTYLLTAS